jgi:hypothetical protein
MKTHAVKLTLLAALAAGGCGSGAQGPAKPEETPVVSQEEVRESYTKGMPPDVKKRYESRMKPGGS